MSQVAEVTENRVNGLDVDALFGVMEEVKRDPSNGKAAFRVSTVWTGPPMPENEAP